MNVSPRDQIQQALPEAWLPDLDPPAHGLERLRLRLHPKGENAPIPLFGVLAMAVLLLIWALGIQWARPKPHLNFSQEDRIVLGLESPSDRASIPANGVQVGPQWLVLVSLSDADSGSTLLGPEDPDSP